MCMRSDFSKADMKMEEKRIAHKSDSISSSSVSNAALVAATFVGGYGLGTNSIDVRVTFFIGALGIVLFASLSKLSCPQEEFTTPFFRWMSQKTTDSRISLKIMASKSSGTALSTLSRVTSVGAIKSISSNFLSNLDCSKTIRSAIQSISRKECFARLDFIERLTINDIAILFRYAANANLNVFNKKKFLAEQTEIMNSVITAIDMAVKVSRGSLSEGTKIITSDERSEGDIDALRFVAVTRIFVEWRNLRMVPKGYKRYAISLSLGYRDVLQNLEKIERGVHDYLKHFQVAQKESNAETSAPIPSPTLRQLLEFEVLSKVHRRLPKLEEKSSANGLLWTKRQLHYQTVLLGNMLEVPMCYASGKEAAIAAYQTVYSEYHGWAVKQIFTRSFGGSPPLEKIWLAIHPPTDSPKLRSSATYKYKSSRNHKKEQLDYPPSLQTLSDITSTTSTSTSERMKRNEGDNEVLIALDKFRLEIIEKWEDMVRMFNCGKEEKRKVNESLILSSESHFNLNQFNRDMVDSSLQTSSTFGDISDTDSILADSTICCEQEASFCSVKKSKNGVDDFVRGLSPMVADLGVLIDQLNMNDPSKA